MNGKWNCDNLATAHRERHDKIADILGVARPDSMSMICRTPVSKGHIQEQTGVNIHPMGITSLNCLFRLKGLHYF